MGAITDAVVFQVGDDGSAEAALALSLAARLDDPGTPASAVGQIAARLLEALQVLRDRKPAEVSPLDEIRARRDARVGLPGSEDRVSAGKRKRASGH